MRHWWWSRCAGALALVAAPALAQGPGFRVTYAVSVYGRGGTDTALLAAGSVSGPGDTGLRLTLRTDTVVVEALLDVAPEPDTLTLGGTFFSRRRLGHSRRGLPIWEEDSYRREVRVAWGHPVRLFPFGGAPPAGSPRLWVELSVTRAFVGGETPPDEAFQGPDSGVTVTTEAVIRPRRATVRLLLVRGDVASAPEAVEMVREAGARRLRFVLGAGTARTLDLTLVRPDPAVVLRDRALALDADVVCLRVVDPLIAGPAWVACGRLNAVARRVPLSDRDTLVAAFAWPPAR